MQFTIFWLCKLEEGILFGEKPNEKTLNYDMITDFFGGGIYVFPRPVKCANIK